MTRLAALLVPAWLCAFNAVAGSVFYLGPIDKNYITQGPPFLGCCQPGTNDRFGKVMTAGDYNGDGRDDLVIGVPHEHGSTAPEDNGGVIHVFYGHWEGLGVLGKDTYGQPDLDINYNGFAEFGAALASGDFNHDGFSDLAIGAPKMSFGVGPGSIADDTGQVTVLYGSSGGLVVPGIPQTQYFNQFANLSGDVNDNDNLGAALAAGDFNGDSYDDLAIGVPNEDISAAADAGGVHVIFGSAAGLSVAGEQFWSQSSSGIIGTANPGDHFGAVLTAGDITGDGYDELVIGVPGEDLGSTGDFDDVGAVHVVMGSAAGLTSTGNEFLLDNSLMEGRSQPGDRFGSALKVINIDGNEYGDLAIGSPYNDEGGPNPDTGLLVILRGSATGVEPVDLSLLAYSSPHTRVGTSISSGDFSSRSYDDYVTGAPGGDISGENPGFILLADATISASTFELTPEVGMGLGESLQAGDFDGDGYDDLAMGMPAKDYDDSNPIVTDAGAVLVTYNQITHQFAIKVVVFVKGAPAPENWEFALEATPAECLSEVQGVPLSIDGAGGAATFSHLKATHEAEPCSYQLIQNGQPDYFLETDASRLLNLPVYSNRARFAELTYVEAAYDPLFNSGFETESPMGNK